MKHIILRNNIKKVIAEQGKTYTWLAKQVGVTKFQVNNWLYHNIEPRPDVRGRLCEALNVSYKDLFYLDEIIL